MNVPVQWRYCPVLTCNTYIDVYGLLSDMILYQNFIFIEHKADKGVQSHLEFSKFRSCFLSTISTVCSTCSRVALQYSRSWWLRSVLGVISFCKALLESFEWNPPNDPFQHHKRAVRIHFLLHLGSHFYFILSYWMWSIQLNSSQLSTVLLFFYCI